MQFISSTWARYGLDANGDGRTDRWEAADAIFAAARYLRSSGAPADYERALLAYNHASWYVAEVRSWAARYRGTGSTGATGLDTATVDAGEGYAAAAYVAAGYTTGGEAAAGYTTGGDAGATLDGLARETDTPVRLIAGAQARLDEQDGHVALIPIAAPPAVQAMLIAGNELQRLPYGPQGHPDPRDAVAEDCSSTVSYVLYRAGVRSIADVLARNPLAQDYVSWGAPGRGRWVTIYATATPTAHVFITIAGLRLDTSHDGTDVGPNSAEDGPRWRVLGHIPTWAQWSVRHPPGL
jgi:hypothetical protein